MLAHLAYVSTRKSNCTEGEIEKILGSCKTNNPSLNITGVLLFSPNQFIQYVEGESKELMQLYDKIKKDERHERVVMVSYGPIAEKTFPSWHMASRNIPTNDIDYLTDIDASDKAVFRKIISEEEVEGNKVRNLLEKFFRK